MADDVARKMNEAGVLTQERRMQTRTATYPLCGADGVLPFLLFPQCERLFCTNDNGLWRHRGVGYSEYDGSSFTQMIHKLCDEQEEKDYRGIFQFDKTLDTYAEWAAKQGYSSQDYPILPRLLAQLIVYLGAHSFEYQYDDANEIKTITFVDANKKNTQ
jgi:hypothetical protein